MDPERAQEALIEAKELLDDGCHAKASALLRQILVECTPYPFEANVLYLEVYCCEYKQETESRRDLHRLEHDEHHEASNMSTLAAKGDIEANYHEAHRLLESVVYPEFNHLLSSRHLTPDELKWYMDNKANAYSYRWKNSYVLSEVVDNLEYFLKHARTSHPKYQDVDVLLQALKGCRDEPLERKQQSKTPLGWVTKLII